MPLGPFVVRVSARRPKFAEPSPILSVNSWAHSLPYATLFTLFGVAAGPVCRGHRVLVTVDRLRRSIGRQTGPLDTAFAQAGEPTGGMRIVTAWITSEHSDRIPVCRQEEIM